MMISTSPLTSISTMVDLKEEFASLDRLDELKGETSGWELGLSVSKMLGADEERAGLFLPEGSGVSWSIRKYGTSFLLVVCFLRR
jgi:hypothetical protein